MATLVKDYIARCDTCQRFKGCNWARAGLLQPLPVPNTPWEHISADFIMNLPLSHSYDSILMVVDRLSKEVELTYGSIMAFHTPLYRTKAHSSWHKLCRSFTRPSVSPLNYRHLSTRKQMGKQRWSINRLGSFNESIALRSRIHGSPGCQLPNSPLIQRNTLQPRSHPLT